MTTQEAGLEGPVAGATDETGQAINGIGHARACGPAADCCKAAPSVLEFDADGRLLRAWGGPSGSRLDYRHLATVSVMSSWRSEPLKRWTSSTTASTISGEDK